MYNFLKTILGIPRNDDRESRNSDFFRRDGDFSNDREDNKWGLNNESEDDIFRHFESSMSRFGFPLFGDLFEMHKYIDGLMMEMERKMGLFDFNNRSGLTWEGGLFSADAPREVEEPSGNSGSLRDSYLKKSEEPLAIESARREDVNLDGKVKIEDVENVLSGKSETNRNLITNQPNVYSKSVYVRIIRRPDGSTEIIKKINDNTGKEETTITQNDSTDPLQPPSIYPLIPSEDRAGLSIFKKFFPF